MSRECTSTPRASASAASAALRGVGNAMDVEIDYTIRFLTASSSSCSLNGFVM
jgi:hypothetical protein